MQRYYPFVLPEDPPAAPGYVRGPPCERPERGQEGGEAGKAVGEGGEEGSRGPAPRVKLSEFERVELREGWAFVSEQPALAGCECEAVIAAAESHAALCGGWSRRYSVCVRAFVPACLPARLPVCLPACVGL